MFDDTVYVLTYPTRVVRGKTIPDYTATPIAAAITGVDVQPGASVELTVEQRQGVEVQWTVFVPAERIPSGVTLNAGSIMRVDGEVFQVQGRPNLWSGSLGYRMVALTAWSAS